MCVILHLEKKITVSKKQLETCYNNNPNGWGIMFSKDGEIKTAKEVSDFKEFLKVWKEVPTDAERAIHFRIKTHGEINDANCHPFSPMPDVFMMHNGVIDTVPMEDKMNDTYNYCKYELAPIMSAWPNWMDDPQFKEIVQKGVGGSRLLFMNNEGKVMKVNTQSWVWRDGIHFSNGGSLDYSVNRSYQSSRNHRGHGSYDNEDFNDDRLPFNQDQDLASSTSTSITGPYSPAYIREREANAYDVLRKKDEENANDNKLNKDQDITVEERARLFDPEELTKHINAVMNEEEMIEEAIEQEEANEEIQVSEDEKDEEEIIIPTMDSLLKMSVQEMQDFVLDYPESAAKTMEGLILDAVNAGLYTIPSEEEGDTTTTKEGLAS